MRSCCLVRKMTLTMATRQWCDVTRCSLIYCFILYIALELILHVFRSRPGLIGFLFFLGFGISGGPYFLE